jgi:two-component system chemotaxis response regulator CheY
MDTVIMVVDDSEMVRKLLTLILRMNGYRTVTAADGMEALERMAVEPVDLVITDINMPVMDGYELVTTIRRDGPNREIPVIMLTTEADEQDRRQGYEAGADVYLTKPAQTQELLASVRTLLAKHNGKEGATCAS